MDPPSSGGSPSFATKTSRIFQTWLDKTVPYIAGRWMFTAAFYILYFVRVFMLKVIFNLYKLFTYDFGKLFIFTQK